MRGEYEVERRSREEYEKEVYRLEKELNQALADLEFTQIIIRDNERVILNLETVNRENLQRIGTVVTIQIQKIK